MREGWPVDAVPNLRIASSGPSMMDATIWASHTVVRQSDLKKTRISLEKEHG